MSSQIACCNNTKFTLLHIKHSEICSHHDFQFEINSILQFIKNVTLSKAFVYSNISFEVGPRLY
jgi:hypothetical protein